jgi:superfamily I DNA and/or RNA helicase
MPGAVQTVDKYQGQQSDYVLLSLVRTKRYLHIQLLLLEFCLIMI